MDRAPKRSKYHENKSKIRLAWAFLSFVVLVVAVLLIAGRGYHAIKRLRSIREELSSDRSATVPAALLTAAGRVGTEMSLLDSALAAGVGAGPIPNARIVVNKSDLQLHFYSADTLLKTYPIALGGGGLADKVRRDDRRTPEGDFYVCEMAMHRNPKAWGDVWIQISYPNEEDANRGRRDGIIDASQHSAIHRALQNGDEPPQDTDLGSGIGIHIGGHEKPDWTLRCMALARASGIEIYEQVRIGTPVVISP